MIRASWASKDPNSQIPTRLSVSSASRVVISRLPKRVCHLLQIVGGYGYGETIEVTCALFARDR